MKSLKAIVSILALAGLAGSLAAGSAGQSPVAADVVIRNAKVVTIDAGHPRAEAVAIKGDRILAVMNDREAAQYIESGRTEVIDARGRLVIPGFNDAHAHFAGLDPDYILLTIPASEIMKTRVDVTVVGGKVVCRRVGS